LLVSRPQKKIPKDFNSNSSHCRTKKIHRMEGLLGPKGRKQKFVRLKKIRNMEKATRKGLRRGEPWGVPGPKQLSGKLIHCWNKGGNGEKHS